VIRRHNYHRWRVAEEHRSRIATPTQIEEPPSDYDPRNCRSGGEAAGGVSIYQVGAATETEMKEKSPRRDTSCHSRSSRGSIRAGGGVALLRASVALKTLKLEGDEQFGVTIVRRACEEPVRQIVHNCGTEGVVVEKIKTNEIPIFASTHHRKVRRPWAAASNRSTK